MAVGGENRLDWKPRTPRRWLAGCDGRLSTGRDGRAAPGVSSVMSDRSFRVRWRLLLLLAHRIQLSAYHPLRCLALTTAPF